MNVINSSANGRKTCSSNVKERSVVEAALDEIIWRVPGSSWWRDCSQPDRDADIREEQISYWLRVPCTDYSGSRNVADTWFENSDGGKMLGRLCILRQGHSLTIGGVELSPINSDQLICIETVIPGGGGGHWKVLWSDRSKKLQLLVPKSRNGKSSRRFYKVETEPLQLSPGVRLIGWVSGRTYPPHEKEGVLPGAVTHNWCFLVPVRIDRLTQLTVYLLPPRTQNTNSPPTRGRLSLDENIVAEGYFSARVLEPYTVAVQNGNLRGGLHRSVANPHLATGLGANCVCHRTITNPLTLLLEPNSRLVMINETISALCSSRFHASSTGHLCPSEPSSDSSLDLWSDRQTDDRSNCYTYIKTKDGLPVYRNGVFISPTRSRLPPERCSSLTDDTQNGRSHSPDSHTIPYDYVFRGKQVNDAENFTTRRTSKTYLTTVLHLNDRDRNASCVWHETIRIHDMKGWISR
ncbi:unnamed protein product [Calicophoron daubneyi]|uniref:Uncharacterized protein n=1 Tax=Calicophoron daubneyi TaxID=300641 RepID=A0AAV2T295_CALDB